MNTMHYSGDMGSKVVGAGLLGRNVNVGGGGHEANYLVGCGGAPSYPQRKVQVVDQGVYAQCDHHDHDHAPVHESVSALCVPHAHHYVLNPEIGTLSP